ncbi:DUF1707 domain-containing protein [Nakamurella flava]|uniref:DUF1707 domain-containing protein n=1 Tax=Nakamurella flava TaxID=2576308 RepID=A0A4U6QJD2_9ACTN|nr:DUF1707 domain-containing protein [Nakamurella flava]TKV60192.1 DUF1707 domain-containing protein [Nakamurella flava]
MTTPSRPQPTSPALLVGDADRARTQDRLTRAVGLGELTLAEFDDRVQAAFRARTADDLHFLLADLPSAGVGSPGLSAWSPPTAPLVAGSLQIDPRPHRPAGPPGRAVRPVTDAWVRWAALATLLIAIWVAVGIPTGAWYPWPIWPILGTAVCAVRQTVEQGRVARTSVGT